MALTDYLPNFEFGSLPIILTLFSGLIFAILISAVIAYFVIMRYLFNKELVLFEKVGGKIVPTLKDKARELRLGDTGDTIFYARKLRRYFPVPQIQTGKRIFWFYKREDGELINFGISDIDKQMKLAGVHYLDSEMRYARAALQKNFKERYQKMGFWERYGGLVAYVALIAIIGIMTFLLFDKWIELSGSVSEAVRAAEDVMKLSRDVLGSIDNIQSGGSGLNTV